MQKAGAKAAKRPAQRLGKDGSNGVAQPGSEIARKKYAFKVLDAEGKVVVKVPFETAAGEDVISRTVFDLVESIAATREAQKGLRNREELRGMKLYRHTLLLRDDFTNEVIDVATTGGFIEEAFTLAEARGKLRATFERYFEKSLSQIYALMVSYARSKGWDVGTMSQAAWREVCRVHPLYSYSWDDQQQREFAATARRSIKRGMARGQYD